MFYLNAVFTYILSEIVNNQCCCHKLRLLPAKIFKSIRSLNLFPSLPPSVDEHQLKTERISTQFYMILLAICFLVLLSYKAAENVTQTITIKAPSYDEYQILYEKQKEKLSCPCSTITSEYKDFLYIKPIFHQLCTSDFISDKWINAEIWQPPVMNNWDFRRQRRLVFSAMASFCSLANETIFNALVSFTSTQMISAEVLSENLFHKNTAQFVADFIQSVNNTFFYNLQLNRASTQTNQIMSGLNTESVPFFIGSYPSFDIQTFSMSYGGCTCFISIDCSENAVIWSGNITVTYRVFEIPGLLIGCYVDEAVRQSTLQCLYNQSCVDTLMFYLNFTAPLKINALNSNSTTIYNINSQINHLVTNLMIEQWIWNDSFQVYYNQCNPSSCFYTLNTKIPFIVILTTLIGLLGGLVKILQIIVPLFVKLVRRPRQPKMPRLGKCLRKNTSFFVRFNNLYQQVCCTLKKSILYGTLQNGSVKSRLF